MTRIGLWHITDEGPKKVERAGVDLEKNLETWIEQDPDLLQAGLKIVGRQIGVEGGKLDLLALDPQGQWVVIELKCRDVRRETIAQALDYASCVATMPYDELEQKVNKYLHERQEGEKTLREILKKWQDEEDPSMEPRDVMIYVVGTGRAPGLERMVDYLSQNFGMPINVVLYQAFEVEGEQRILARELTDLDTTPLPVSRKPQRSVEEICALADKAEVGREFRAVLEAIQKYSDHIHARPYKQSIMYTPKRHRGRTLFTVWARPKADGLLRVYVETGAFAEFYPVTDQTAKEILGSPGWRGMTPQDVDIFVQSLERLFASMEAQE